MPSFLQVLTSLANAWETRREEVTRVGADVAAHLGQRGDHPESAVENIGARAVAGLHASYDVRFGASAPRRSFHRRWWWSSCCGGRPGPETRMRWRWPRGRSRRWRAVACTTRSEAASPGTAWTRAWDVPHFEKMLYDNALLLRAYLHWWRQTGSALGERVARDTAEFVLRELATDEGGFASALDADSDGEEGVFYVWTPAQLVEALGQDDGRYAVGVLRPDAGRQLRASTSTLRLDADPVDEQRHASVVSRLLAARGDGPDRHVTTRWSPPGTG